MATKTLEMISLKKDPTQFERIKITSSNDSANYIIKHNAKRVFHFTIANSDY